MQVMRIKKNDHWWSIVLIFNQILPTSNKKYKENSEENTDVNIGA